MQTPLETGRTDCSGGRYRCFLHRSYQPAETGVLEFVQLRARCAEHAARLALAVSGAASVVEVVRLEGGAA